MMMISMNSTLNPDPTRLPGIYVQKQQINNALTK